MLHWMQGSIGSATELRRSTFCLPDKVQACTGSSCVRLQARAVRLGKLRRPPTPEAPEVARQRHRATRLDLAFLKRSWAACFSLRYAFPSTEGSAINMFNPASFLARILIAVTVTMAGCTPNTPFAQPATSTDAASQPPEYRNSAAPASAKLLSGEADPTLSPSGMLRAAIGDALVGITSCTAVQVSPRVHRCAGDTYIDLIQAGKAYSILLTSLYVDLDATFYRGPLDESYSGNGHSFFLTDVDGDGNEDFIAWTGKDGAYGGPSYDVLLFDAKSNDFAVSPRLSELTIGANGIFRIVGNRLTTTSTDGCCTRVVDTYALDKSEPTLVERVTETSDPETGVVVSRTERMVQGKLRTVD